MKAETELGGYEPCNGAHSILACAVSIDFVPSQSLEHWAGVRTSVIEAARHLGLPMPQPFYGLNLTFEPTGVNVGLNSPASDLVQNTGLTFTRLSEDTEERIEQFVVTHDSIFLKSFSYIRWTPFFERFSKLINFIYPHFIAYKEFSSTKLEFWDRFDAKNGNRNPKSVISSKGAFVPPQLAATDDLWHSHSGRFDRLSDYVRRLIQTRVDIGEPQGMPEAPGNLRTISIYSMTQDSRNAPGYMQTNGRQISLEEVLGQIREQHSALKGILRDVITADAADRIGLETP